MLNSLLARRTSVILLDPEVWVYYDNLYETGHNEAQNGWIIQKANNPLIKCNFHSFVHIPRGKAPKDDHWMCHTVTYHVSFTSHQCFSRVCVNMSVQVQFPLCTHAEVRGGQWVSSRQDTSLYRKPHHFVQASWPSDSWYLTVFASQCWSYKHMKLCPDFLFYLFFYVS